MAIQELNSYNRKIQKNQNNSRLDRSNHLCSTINTKTASLSSISTKKTCKRNNDFTNKYKHQTESICVQEAQNQCVNRKNEDLIRIPNG